MASFHSVPMVVLTTDKPLWEIFPLNLGLFLSVFCGMRQFFGLALLTLMIMIWWLMISTVFKNGHSTSIKAANCTYKSQCSLFLSQIIYCLFGSRNIVQHLVITFQFLHCYIFSNTVVPNQSSAIFAPLTLLSCHNWLIVAVNRTCFGNRKKSIFCRF